MPTANSFTDFLSSIALRGRSIIGIRTKSKQVISGSELIGLCHQLLSSKGEASGIALSNEILTCYNLMGDKDKTGFFLSLYDEFSARHDAMETAARAYLEDPSIRNMGRLSDASEPIRRQLIMRLNLAPNATQLLINMRADLLDRLSDHPELIEVDKDFVKLFSSWFNGGFLQLNMMNWASPASLLEKVIKYEAVHGMSGWDDLKERIAPTDRLIYGFFHPRLNSEPLIFIEVALTRELPSKISAILSKERKSVNPKQADTAVFYSISNCQKGLRGIPLGSFLIKQVVEDLKSGYPDLKEFATLSPIPGFASWLKNLAPGASDNPPLALSVESEKQLTKIIDLGWHGDETLTAELKPFVTSAVAWYLANAKSSRGLPVDPVAKFHLGNGARLERINWPADTSEHGISNSFGAMVNYSYRIDEIEQNHERFVESGDVNISPEATRMVKTLGKYLAKATNAKNEPVS